MEFKDINNKETFLTNVNEVCALLEAYSNKDFTGYDSKEDLIDIIISHIDEALIAILDDAYDYHNQKYYDMDYSSSWAEAMFKGGEIDGIKIKKLSYTKRVTFDDKYLAALINRFEEEAKALNNYAKACDEPYSIHFSEEEGKKVMDEYLKIHPIPGFNLRGLFLCTNKEYYNSCMSKSLESLEREYENFKEFRTYVEENYGIQYARSFVKHLGAMLEAMDRKKYEAK